MRINICRPVRCNATFWCILFCKQLVPSRNSSVGIAIRLRARLPIRFRFGIGVRNFSLSITSRRALGPTHPRIQLVPQLVSPGVERQRRDADHSPPSSAEVKNGGLILSYPHYRYAFLDIMLNYIIK
jgi:hypothetical protein